MHMSAGFSRLRMRKKAKGGIGEQKADRSG